MRALFAGGLGAPLQAGRAPAVRGACRNFSTRTGASDRAIPLKLPGTPGMANRSVRQFRAARRLRAIDAAPPAIVNESGCDGEGLAGLERSAGARVDMGVGSPGLQGGGWWLGPPTRRSRTGNC